MNIEEPEQTQARAPNRLIVEEPSNDDNSICLLNEEKMKELKIFNGDPVVVRGKRRNKTLLIAVKDNKLPSNKIAFNKVARGNLKLKIGDLSTISPAETVPDLKKIHVLPYQDSIEGIAGDIVTSHLIPYFKDVSRPLHVGDRFIVRGNFRPVEFRVLAVEPGEFGIVTSQTLLFTEGKPIVREEEDNSNDVGYEDIGGCRR